MVCLRVSRALAYLGAVYVAISMIYTTTSHLLQLHRALTTYYGRNLFTSSISWLAPGGKQAAPAPLARTHHDLIHAVPPGTIFWNSSTQQPAAETPEDLFLSKAFSNSMRPSKIIPYFYRATNRPAANDITMTTLITSNRFHVFSRLVERYQGAQHQSLYLSSPNSS